MCESGKACNEDVSEMIVEMLVLVEIPVGEVSGWLSN
jgi:hypothetical protein